MKRFIIKTVFLTLVSVVMVNVIMLYGKDRHSLYSHEKNVIISYNRLMALKDTNKIVIIAGSNGGFSINSQMISEAFHRPVVNTSTHAGIGVRMQFEVYKDFLCKGDVVIFCPEYGGDKKRLYGESTLLRILSTHMPFAYRKLSIPQWIFIYKYIGISFSEKKDHSRAEDFKGPYSEHALNEYGDIEWDRPHNDSIKGYRLKGIVGEDVIEYYKYIHRYTNENEILLVFLPPTFMERDFVCNSEQIDSIASCFEQNGIGYQAQPSRYSFPDSLYYDTPYHMTQLGANKRTEMLIEDLNRILSKDGKI